MKDRRNKNLILTTPPSLKISQIRFPAVVLAFIICCIACKESSVTQKLLEIERKIDNEPEAMLDSLRDIDYNRLQTDRDKAIYGMLLTEACDKNYCLEGADSLISFAVNYFERTDDQLRSLISTYYYGRLLYNNKDYPRSIALFHAAKDMAEEQEEYFWAGMACRGISDIHNESYNIDEELKYARLEYENIKRSGKQPYINYALLDICTSLCNAHQLDSVQLIAKQLVDSSLKYEDHYLRHSSLELSALSYLKSLKYDTAVAIYRDLCSSPLANLNDSIHFAYSCMESQNKEEAIGIINKIKCQSNMISFTKYKIYKKLGLYDKALYELECKDSITETLFKTRINTDLTTTTIDYYKDKDKDIAQSLELEKLKKWIYVLSIIIVFSIVSCTLLLNLSNKKKEINSKVLLAEELTESFLKAENENSKAAGYIRYLLASKYSMLEEICDIMIKCNNSKLAKQRVADSISNLISNLSIHSEQINKLEKEIDSLYENLFTDFRNDLPSLKDEDYRLYLFSILKLSNSTISILLQEEKVSAVYDRKRRLKDKIKQLDKNRAERYLSFLQNFGKKTIK